MSSDDPSRPAVDGASAEDGGSQTATTDGGPEYPSPLRRPQKPPETLRVKRKWDPPPQPLNVVRKFLGATQAEYRKEYGEWIDRVRAADEQGIKTLFEHYEVSPDDELALEKLVLLMARDYIPGFQMEWRSGRPKEWPALRYALLYVSVIEKQLRNPRLSASAAADKQYRRYTTAKKMFAKPDAEFPPALFEMLKKSDIAVVTQYRQLLERMLDSMWVAENRWLEIDPTE